MAERSLRERGSPIPAASCRATSSTHFSPQPLAAVSGVLTCEPARQQETVMRDHNLETKPWMVVIACHTGHSVYPRAASGVNIDHVEMG